ncbi:MAG: hypothetical protein ACK5H2_11115 [Beutenbergiaceae bacterium]
MPAIGGCEPAEHGGIERGQLGAVLGREVDELEVCDLLMAVEDSGADHGPGQGARIVQERPATIGAKALDDRVDAGERVSSSDSRIEEQR